MSKKTNAIEEAMRCIDNVTAPSRMGKTESLDVIEDIIEQCKSRCEALREEMDDE